MNITQCSSSQILSFFFFCNSLVHCVAPMNLFAFHLHYSVYSLYIRRKDNFLICENYLCWLLIWTCFDLLQTAVASFFFQTVTQQLTSCACFRYIYVPLGGSRHGPFYRVLSTGLAFGFVCLWHGGHDYLRYWALMNWAGVLVENGLQSFFGSSRVHAVVVSLKSTHLTNSAIMSIASNSLKVP